MNKTDETPDFIPSYIDLKKNAIQIGQAGGRFTEMWVQYMHNTMINVLEQLSSGKEDKANQAFLDALEKAKRNSSKMIDEMTSIMAEQVGDAYNIGFSEGSHMANSLNSKTLRKLITDGLIEDPRGQIESYLKICDKIHADALRETMKGKSLTIYKGETKNGTKKDNA